MWHSLKDARRKPAINKTGGHACGSMVMNCVKSSQTISMKKILSLASNNYGNLPAEKEDLPEQFQ